MKRVLVATLFLFGATFSQAQDMTVDEIVDNYIDAIGGREAWSKVNGHKMVASASVQGMDLPIVSIELKDGRQITTYTFQGQEMVQGAFDGETLWSTSFMTMKAEKGDSEDAENVKRSIGEYPDPFMTYKDKGYTVELDGEDVKDGVDCYKVKMNKGKRLVEGEEVDQIAYYYFDKETFVPIVIETEVLKGQMKGQMSSTLMSDYQEVDGLYYPFSISQGGDFGSFTLTVEEIILNPEVKDDQFAFPGEE